MNKALKTDGKYYLYKIDKHLELWRGKIGGKYSYRAGYVMDADNFEVACYEADEEMRSLIAQGV